MRHSLRIGAAALLIACATATLHAQDPVYYMVDSLGDAPAANPGDGTGKTVAGDVTLRSAIMAANADGAPSVIEFAFALVAEGPAEIVVGSTLPTITTQMGIYGRGADLLTVRSNGPRIFAVQGSSDAIVSRLTITGSTLGAVQNNGGVLAIADCVLRDNNGLVTGLVGGGAIDNRNGGALTIRNSVIGPNNTATFSGALDNYVGSPNQIVAINSTFVGNQVSEAGGVLYNGGGSNTATFINCTITQNTAGGDAGALYQEETEGGLTVLNSTIVGNTAGRYCGGIYLLGSTNTLLVNTVLSGNLEEAGVEVNVDGTVSSASEHNLIGENRYLEGIVDGANGNQIGTGSSPLNPQLGPLADNGGPVATMLPQESSPLIDSGTVAIPPAVAGWGITTDARGLARLSGPTVDIGAVEIQVDAPPAPGDVNGDGYVNVADVTALARHVEFGDGIVGDGDYNADESVDMQDVADLADGIANGTVPVP